MEDQQQQHGENAIYRPSAKEIFLNELFQHCNSIFFDLLSDIGVQSSSGSFYKTDSMSLADSIIEKKCVHKFLSVQVC